MPTLLSIAAFELRYQVKGPVFITALLFFGLIVFGGVTVDNIQIGASNAVHLNSPFATTSITLVMSIFGLFIPTALLASTVLRDTEMRTAPLLFSTPIQPRTLILGRFLGGFAASVLAFSSVPVAAFVGAQMPWLDPEMLGEVGFLPYLQIFLQFGVTNLFATGMILFTVANLSRSSFATYVTLVAFLMLYFTGIALAQEPQYRDVVALLDPLANITFNVTTRYWTPIERNTLVAPLTGLLLYNRLLWTGIGLGLLGLNVLTFKLRTEAPARRWPWSKTSEEEVGPEPVARHEPVRPRFDRGTAWAQLVARTMHEARSITRSPAFWLLLALGLFNALAALLLSRSLYGLSTYPVTRRIIDILRGSFEFIPIIVIVYYSGELISRDRRLNAHEMVDATPVPSWVLFLSKLLGLALVVLSLMTAAGLAGVGVQIAQGYFDLEPHQYLVRLGIISSVPLVLVGVLSLFFQVVTANRWLGMLAMVGFVILTVTLSNVGFEDRLYQFAEVPDVNYSDLNGYGQFLGVSLYYIAYYVGWAVVLSVLAFGLWGRGEAAPIWRRLRPLPGRIGRGGAALMAMGLGLSLGFGAFIFHNTHQLNTFQTRDDRMDRSAKYEQTYGELEGQPTPKVTAVEAKVDIFPEERRYTVSGSYLIENRSPDTFRTLHLDYPFELQVHAQALEGGTLSQEDVDLGHYVWRLDEPWAPGTRRKFTFRTERRNPGFKNGSNVSSVNPNGTFFNNVESMPQIGFDVSKILTDRPERRERELPKRPRAPKLEDERFHRVGMLRADSDWVTFTTTVSTTRDQIAIAPGYLEKSWEKGERRYFSYRMDAPIQNFFAYLSARYRVVEDEYDGVKLQVFHHSPHHFNVGGMMNGMKKALRYGADNFSPFQYRQMRIFEFPNFIGRFAQSFPNSVPYSEAIGFIADVRDPDDIDAIFYVTAHEVAHQWFGHQLSAAPNQGVTMLIESFAQYMALMVMKREFGEDMMRRFLKYELDSYLTGRGGELIEELPLYRVENQPYIHYQKGSIVMYALQDYMGEARVNAVIRRLIAERGFDESRPLQRYPLSTDFLRRLRAEAKTEAEQALITDLFEKIVLLDLEVTEAEAEPTPEGQWKVAVTVRARKLEANGKGEETEVPLELDVDIGAFSKSLDGPLDPSPGARGGHVLALSKHLLTTGTHRIELLLDEKPVVVGVDPYNKLVDRDSEDNVHPVTIVERVRRLP